ncbi:hypothetical protein Tco_0883474, partial [Tanacetum coccineum]
EEPEEDGEDPEEDPADYPADRDDDDDEEEVPSRDDADDEDEDEDKDEEEEEEHPAPADSIPRVHRMTARISIRDEPSISLLPREEVERLLALTTPPPSPLTPLSSPLPQIPSPTLPASPPTSVLPVSPPASLIRPLGYRAAMIRLRAETLSTSHPLPLPTSSPPLQLISYDRRTDRPEIILPPRKRLVIDLGPRYEIRESSAAATTRPTGGRRADYGIRDVWVDPREAVEEVAPMTLGGVNTRVTELATGQEQLGQQGPSRGPALPVALEEAGIQQAVISHCRQLTGKSHMVVTLVDATVQTTKTGPVYKQLKVAERTTDSIWLIFRGKQGPRKMSAQPEAPGSLKGTNEKDHEVKPSATPTPVTDTHTTTSVHQCPNSGNDNKALLLHWQHVMQPGMAMIAILQERVPEGLALREWLDSLSGLKRWSFPTLFTALMQLYSSMPLSNLLRVPSKEMLLQPTFPRTGTNVRSDVSGRNRPSWNMFGGLGHDTSMAMLMATKPKNNAGCHLCCHELRTSKINTRAETSDCNKRKSETPPGTTRISNQTNTQHRRTYAAGKGDRDIQRPRPLCSKEAITIEVHKLPNATSATDLDIILVTA